MSVPDDLRQLKDRLIRWSLRLRRGDNATKPLPELPPEQRPLTLVWPSEYRVYTQRFGARPEYYGKFGLPGHEGVDIRALHGSTIVACADGVVQRVGWNTADKAVATNAYGYQIRIEHVRSDGVFVTIYAHLTDGSAVVKVGERVKAGRLIALADNTGNSGAAHLHLSLKKRGEKNGGYGELIDPAPYLEKIEVIV